VKKIERDLKIKRRKILRGERYREKSGIETQREGRDRGLWEGREIKKRGRLKERTDKEIE
jgi:hypothetical protein